MMSLENSHSIQIKVLPEYDPQRSKPDVSLFVYRYTITIKNKGSDVVQLLSRHWKIRNAFNEVEDVKGPGVVGQNPILKPGEEFTYTSLCPLNTPTGSMQGSFQFKDEFDSLFEAPIEEFFFKNNNFIN